LAPEQRTVSGRGASSVDRPADADDRRSLHQFSVSLACEPIDLERRLYWLPPAASPMIISGATLV
jgi:hypothetical protein